MCFANFKIVLYAEVYTLKLILRHKGFTLIEVSVSLVILSISLLALASLMTMTMKNNSSGNHVTEAVTFAQDKLEDLRIRQWDYVTTNKDTHSVSSTGITYIRDWVVQPNADNSLKTINITVTWNDGKDHSISILSAISN